MMKKILLLLTLSLVSLFAFAQNAEEDPDVLYAGDMIQPGKVAPDFALKDLEGKTVHLHDFRGRYVLIVFWASWCPDCRAEIPTLRAMYEKYDPEMVTFLQVSFDRTEDKWKEFVTKEELPGIHVFDPKGKKDSAVCAAYGVKWIPSLVLVGPEGRVARRTVVAERIDRFLDRIRDFESRPQFQEMRK